MSSEIPDTSQTLTRKWLEHISEKRRDSLDRDIKILSLARTVPAIVPTLDQNSPDRKIRT